MGQFQTTPPHPPLPERAPEVFPVHRGRRILVTGAAGGIGLATAQLLAAEAAEVVMADIRGAALEAACAALAATGARCHAVVFDAGRPEAIAAGVAAAEAAAGGLDGLACCAAIVRHADPLDTPWRDWEDIFAVNAFGTFEIARLVARGMIARGRRGAIVTVGSEAGKKGHKESLAYSASKAGLIGITRMLAEVLAPHDINVNCVCPGGVATDMLREVAVAYGARVGAAPDEVFPRLIGSQLQRHIAPAEVARVISFLLGDGATILRGQALSADGGDTPY